MYYCGGDDYGRRSCERYQTMDSRKDGRLWVLVGQGKARQYAAGCVSTKSTTWVSEEGLYYWNEEERGCRSHMNQSNRKLSFAAWERTSLVWNDCS
jgi:hypothetical protein